MNLVGQMLGGRFELLELIGEGGYGEVYLANQRSMDREVAIKVIHPHLAATPGVTERFEREARVASKLHHPNTVVYFDFGKDDNLLFLAMEYVRGRALSDVLVGDSAFGLDRGIHIILQVLGALREAHRESLIHRDLKPANILITERAGDPNFVKVIDFGLAKIVRGPNDSQPPEDGPTQTGAIIGTPAYMAPEQIRGEQLDGRCDLYALGVMLFVMLTGHKPFQGNTPVETAAMHLTQPAPSVRALNPTVPEAIEALVLKLLAKDRTERPPDAEVVMRTLARFMDLPTPSGSSGLTRMVVQSQIAQSSGNIPRALAPVTVGSVPEDVSGGDTLHYGETSGAPAVRTSPLLILALLTALFAAGGTVLFILLDGPTNGEPEEITVSSTAEPDDESAVEVVPPQTAESQRRSSPGADHAVEQGVAIASGVHGFGVARTSGLRVVDTASGIVAQMEQTTSSRRSRTRRRRPEREEPEVEVAPVATTGTLVITARPWGTVYCGGSSWGEAPAERDVDPGDYDCTIRGPRGQVERLEAHVDSGQTTRETVSFD